MTERELTGGDIDALMEFQAQIHREMPHADWLVETDREQYEYIFASGGYGLGLFEDGKMCGAWVLYYPFDRGDGLARLLGLDERRTAHLEMAMLSPALRGRGLHSRMVRALTDYAARDGRFTHVAATVHPSNAASLRGFTGCGYQVFGVREMYGGLARCIVYKKVD